MLMNITRGKYSRCDYENKFVNSKDSNILDLYSASLGLINEVLNHCVNYTSNHKQCHIKI